MQTGSRWRGAAGRTRSLTPTGVGEALPGESTESPESSRVGPIGSSPVRACARACHSATVITWVVRRTGAYRDGAGLDLAMQHARKERLDLAAHAHDRSQASYCRDLIESLMDRLKGSDRPNGCAAAQPHSDHRGAVGYNAPTAPCAPTDSRAECDRAIHGLAGPHCVLLEPPDHLCVAQLLRRDDHHRRHLRTRGRARVSVSARGGCARSCVRICMCAAVSDWHVCVCVCGRTAAVGAAVALVDWTLNASENAACSQAVTPWRTHTSHAASNVPQPTRGNVTSTAYNMHACRCAHAINTTASEQNAVSVNATTVGLGTALPPRQDRERK